MNIKEKTQRIKYIRALEKLAKRAVLALKKQDFNKTCFDEQMLKARKDLSKLEPVYLDLAYTKELLAFVNKCLASKYEQNELVQAANKLEQLKNAKTYKKNKHKKAYKYKEDI